MQLDVDVSPPAFSLTRCAYTGFNLGNFSFMTLSLTVLEILAILNFGPVTTDDRRKAMHKSPPCISTGGLKERLVILYRYPQKPISISEIPEGA